MTGKKGRIGACVKGGGGGFNGGMKGLWKWVLLVMVAAAPWLYGLSFPFVYDDLGMISENAFLAEPGHEWKVWSGQTLMDETVLNGRRPAVLASYFRDRALYGLQPKGWRVTNVIFHLLNAAGVAVLAWKLSGRRSLGGLAGVLFALHPMVTEAVHSPGFRADVMCLFWMLAGVLAGIAALEAQCAWKGRCWGAAALAAVAVALLSKETALVWPVAMGAVAWGLPAREGHWRWVGLAVGGGVLAGMFFALWCASGGELQAAGGGAWNGESLRWPENVWSVPALWSRELRLLLVPWPLNVTPRFEAVRSVGDGRFWMGLFWMAIGTVAAWKARRRAPVVTLGLAWMAIFFAPVSNVWPLYHPVADRYFYPVVPGFALLTAWLLDQQSPGGRRWGGVLLAGLYGALIVGRLWQWGTPERLWSAAYYQNSQSADAAVWLGLLSEEKGDGEGAEVFYRAATEANPQSVRAWVNRGVRAGKCGRWEESEAYLRRALELNPEHRAAQRNLETCRRLQARATEAATEENFAAEGALETDGAGGD